MAFKLGMCAEPNWRRLRGFKDLAKVIRGVEFKDGIEIEEPDQERRLINLVSYTRIDDNSPNKRVSGKPGAIQCLGAVFIAYLMFCLQTEDVSQLGQNLKFYSLPGHS